MTPGLHLTAAASPQPAEDVEYMKDNVYMRTIGKLNYLTLGTCPDISFTTSVLAHFSGNPGPEHRHAVKYLFCYIKGTMNYKLTYGHSPHPTAFLSLSDVGDWDKARSTSGWVILMGGGVVSWSSTLQTRFLNLPLSQTI